MDKNADCVRFAVAAVFIVCCYREVSGQHCGEVEQTESIWKGGTYDHDLDLPTTKPLVIAHRGASGMLPEHTVEAYQLAIDQGADVIECDLAVTSDLQLVCLHDSWLSTTTDAPNVFSAERRRTYFIPDHDFPQNITDHFALDFTLAEIKTLRKKERFTHRDSYYDGKFLVPTLEEFIEVAQKNAQNGKKVGIAPEIKNPIFMNEHPTLVNANVKMHDILLPILQQYGYSNKKDPCFVQSFDIKTLIELAKKTVLPLVYLFRKERHDISLDDLRVCEKLCYAVGPHKTHVVRIDDANHILDQTDLVQNAHQMGLRVYPYTFRNDAEFLPWNYGKDSTYEILDFMQLGVDGFFSDFPLTVRRTVDENHPQPNSKCHVQD